MLPNEESRLRSLDRRLERVGWGLFLVMIGGLWLVPGVQQGVWLVGTGVIMLGLNVARYMNGIHMSNFTLVLGVAAIVLGAGQMLGGDLPVLAVLLIVVGANVVWRTATIGDRGVS